MQNSTFPIRLRYSSYNNIINNTANDNGGYGFYFRDYSSYNNIINNTANDNGEYGFRFRDSSNNNKVANNTVCYNTFYDYYCGSSIGTTGTGNKFTNIYKSGCTSWPVLNTHYTLCS